VNLVLSELPDFTALPGGARGPQHCGTIHICESLAYMERAWDDAKYGRPSRNPYVEAVFPTVHEPALAPEGTELMLAFVQYGPYELAGSDWETERDGFGRRVIETLGEYMPDIEGSVEQIEVLAPPDLERRFGLLGGNIMQGEMTPDQSFFLRPILGYADYTTPIEGLFMCGSGTHPGGGVMGVPGHNCAQVIARAARRHRSSVLGRLRDRLP